MGKIARNQFKQLHQICMKRFKQELIIWIIVIAIIAGLAIPHHHKETVEQFREQFIAGFNQFLSEPNNVFFQRIEAAHVTVTAKNASVTSCSVSTVDGTDAVGPNADNISEIDVIITVTWDGWIQKDGFTELEIDYDNRNDIIKETKYLRSSAMINLDNVDWGDLGLKIGTFVGSSSG